MLRRAFLLVLVAALVVVVAPPVHAEPNSPGATTLTRVCAEGQTITFSFAGVGAQWAVHVDSIDGVPAEGIFVIVHWSVFNPATGVTRVVRDVPVPLDTAQCTFTRPNGTIVTARYFQTPAN